MDVVGSSVASFFLISRLSAPVTPGSEPAVDPLWWKNLLCFPLSGPGLFCLMVMVQLVLVFSLRPELCADLSHHLQIVL